jgi:hypothetical protein
MPKKPKAKEPGTVREVIKPIIPSEPEKAEIEVHGADDLYKEIRIENKLVDSKGKKVKLKPNAPVDVTVEADEKDTVAERERITPLPISSAETLAARSSLHKEVHRKTMFRVAPHGRNADGYIHHRAASAHPEMECDIA